MRIVPITCTWFAPHDTWQVRDLKEKYQKAKASADKAQATATFFDESMPLFLQKMERAVSLAGCSNGPALVGVSLSLADVTVFVLLADFFGDKGLVHGSLKLCPRLKASFEAVGSDARICRYRRSRPQAAP